VKKLRGFHGANNDIDSTQERSIMFNYFGLFRMRNPHKMMSWAIVTALSDFDCGVMDVSLWSMSYFGTHVSAAYATVQNVKRIVACDLPDSEVIQNFRTVLNHVNQKIVAPWQFPCFSNLMLRCAMN